jgi:MSHA pilin protein MshD
MRSFRHTPCFRRSAFTLLEATLSIVIVAVMLCAAMSLVSAYGRSRNSRQDLSRAMLLAQQLMSEIVQCSYSDPTTGSTTFGPDSGETRANYDDVDDYNGLSESPPANRAGTAIPGFTGWSRSVQVSYVDPTTPTTVISTDKGVKRIVVTVKSPSGKVQTLTALRSTSGVYEHVPSTQTTYTSWVGVTLQTGTSSSASVSSTVDTVNLVP